ncbi:MAG TPA: GntR family transcriptional regulator [Stellaceae bacterium]|nr:GntR family transcriptional regulator [Stellaceae bacterium]
MRRAIQGEAQPIEAGSAAERQPPQRALTARLRPVNRPETLGDQAYRSLRTALRRGALSPGERLTTREIAATLGVSLTPAREALNRLVAERVLEQGPDRTVIVPILTRDRYEELCVIRLNLEGLAAEIGCTKMTAAQLARMEALYTAHGEAYRRRATKDALRLNEDFHFMIYGAAGMPSLLQILETLWLQVGPSMNLLFPVSYDAGWKGGRHHAAMLEAIRRRDPKALVRAVQRDLEDGRAVLKRLLPE